MDISTFGQKIKAKYPQYQNIDDAELGQKMLAKYPEYQSQIDSASPAPQSDASQPMGAGAQLLQKLVNRGINLKQDASLVPKRPDQSFMSYLATNLNPEKPLRGAGEIAGGINDIIGAVTNVGINAVANPISNIPAVQKFASSAPVSGGLDAINNLIGSASNAYQGFAQQHPNISKDMASIGNLASIYGMAKGTQAVGSAAADTKLGQKAIGAVQDNAVNNLEDTYNELLSGQAPSKAKKFYNAQNVTEAKNAAGTMGTPPQRTLAEAGIIPKQEGSKLATLDQADAFRQSAAPLAQTNQEALRVVDKAVPPVPLDDIQAKAIEQIRASNNTSAQKEAMVRQIQKEIEATKAEYGDAVPPSILDKIKSQHWDAAKKNKAFDNAGNLQRNVNYSMGSALQKTIEQVASDAGYNDVAQLNRHIGDVQEAANFLEGLNGKVLKKGQLGGYAAKGLGALVGSHGGMLGTVIGYKAGDALHHLIMSNSVAGPVKRLILNGLAKQDPAAYKNALEFLAKSKL